MRTAHLPTVCTSVATRCQYWWGGERGPVKWGPMNKFEQISSDGYLMPLAGEPGPGSPMSGGGGCRAVPMSTLPDRQIRLKTLPSRNFVGGRWLYKHKVISPNASISLVLYNSLSIAKYWSKLTSPDLNAQLLQTYMLSILSISLPCSTCRVKRTRHSRQNVKHCNKI